MFGPGYDDQPYSRQEYRFLVLPRFQLKIVGLTFFTLVGAMVLATWAFYYLVENQFIKSLSMANLSANQRLEILNDFTLSYVYFVIVMGAFCLFMVGFAAVYSHKIAGPIFKMGKILDQFNGGDHRVRVHLRRGDELNELSEKINAALQQVCDSQQAKSKTSHLA